MRYESLQALRKEDGSTALISTTPIHANTIIHILAGEAKERTMYTIEQEGVHYIDDKIMYMNHSCDPNCIIKDKQIISIKTIQPFSEITFDYATTEKEILHSFECRCGSPECRGKIYK